MQEVTQAAGQQFIRESEVAARLGMSVRTVQGWRARGEGPKFVKLGRGLRCRVVYSVAELAEFTSRNSFQSTTEAQAAKTRPVRRATRGRGRR